MTVKPVAAIASSVARSMRLSVDTNSKRPRPVAPITTIHGHTGVASVVPPGVTNEKNDERHQRRGHREMGRPHGDQASSPGPAATHRPEIDEGDQMPRQRLDGRK